MGFMVRAFYWLFLWDFKKESLSRFLWHSQNKKLPVRPTGGFLFIGDKERILYVLLDAGEGFMAWMWIDVVMWIASFAAYI